MTQTEKVVKRLSEILLYEMGKDELTNAEMAKRCGISKRKFEEIIYREPKGMLLETFLTICQSLNLNASDVLDF